MNSANIRLVSTDLDGTLPGIPAAAWRFTREWNARPPDNFDGLGFVALAAKKIHPVSFLRASSGISRTVVPTSLNTVEALC